MTPEQIDFIRRLLGLPGDAGRLILLPIVRGYLKNCLLQQPKKRTFKVIRGVNREADSLTYSRDGRLLASSNTVSFKIQIWDPYTANELRTIPTKNVYALAFSPTEDILVAGMYEKIEMYNTNTWEMIRSIPTAMGIEEVSFSRNGLRFVYVDGSFYTQKYTVKIFDTVTWKEILTLKGQSASLSPDGSRVVVVNWSKLTMLNLRTGKEDWAIFLPETSSFVLYSPDGSKVAVVFNGQIFIYDAESGKHLLTIPSVKGIFKQKAAFSPDGYQIAEDSGAKLFIADVFTGKKILQQGEIGVFSLAFSPDGTKLAFGTKSDNYEPIIKILNLYDAADIKFLQDLDQLPSWGLFLVYLVTSSYKPGTRMNLSTTEQSLQQTFGPSPFFNLVQNYQNLAEWKKPENIKPGEEYSGVYLQRLLRDCYKIILPKKRKEAPM